MTKIIKAIKIDTKGNFSLTKINLVRENDSHWLVLDNSIYNCKYCKETEKSISSLGPYFPYSYYTFTLYFAETKHKDGCECLANPFTHKLLNIHGKDEYEKIQKNNNKVRGTMHNL